MSFAEFERILDDPKNPLHQKAKQVSRELTEPIAQMAREVVIPLATSFAKIELPSLLPKFETLGLLPKIDLAPVLAAYDTSSWISKVAIDFPKIAVPIALFDQVKLIESAQLGQVSDRESIPEIDYEALEPPDMTVAEIAEITETRMSEARDTIIKYLPTTASRLAELVEEAKSNSKAKKQSIGWSKVAAIGAILGAAFAAVGAFATLLK